MDCSRAAVCRVGVCLGRQGVRPWIPDAGVAAQSVARRSEPPAQPDPEP